MKYVGIYVFAVLIASCSQILLKVSAERTYRNHIREYLNLRVIVAYAVLLVSMILTMIGYRGVPLSYGPMIDSLGYVFVGILGALFLSERLTPRKLAGMALIVGGILMIQIF